MELTRLVVIGILLAILWSLGSAFVAMTRKGGDGAGMVRALTWRIALSVCLFAFLVFAAREGWILPHGLTR